ncbi:MAG: TetR/AcrR family transcriptional regulator [Xanthobacteraceae bacterium]
MANKATKQHPSRGKAASRPRKRSKAPYHHGDLHEALLKAAERVLERDGLAGLTLRAAAREAGVSHAAPAHHFGDVTGLLSELAAVGFRRFAASLRAAAAKAVPAQGDARLLAIGMAYVAFAREYPGLFMLMFRGDRLDIRRPALEKALQESNMALASAIGELRNEAVIPERPTVAQAAQMVRSWSMVHGFATLLLDRRLDGLLALLPETSADDLLSAMLNAD